MSKAESKQKYLEEKQERREAMLLEKKLLNIKIVEMNKEIARCADRKDLNKAMALFEEAKDKNTHTYAAIMNVCVRCGDLPSVIRLFDELRKCDFYKQLDLVCCTTLMKGYCGEGDVPNALRLLRDMVAQRPHPVSPNIRTINTILRGCVLIGDNKSAYDLLAQCAQFKPPVKPDESTMEQVVTLATQALDLDRVFPLVGRLAAQSSAGGGSGSFAMSGMYVCVARACALLHQWKQAGKYLQLARSALVAEAAAGGTVGAGAGDEEVEEVREVRGATGGKKAWGGEADGARAKSLQVYIDHKRAEQHRELDGIEAYVTAAKAAAGSGGGSDHCTELVDSYRRFVLFPHASLPAYDVREEAKAAEETRVEAGAYERLGLTRLAKTGASVDKEKEKTKGKDKGSKRKAGEMEGGEGEGAGAAVEAPVQSGLLYQFSQHLARAVNNARGKLDFGAIFGAGEAGAKRPLKLEICTGAGEWIVAQAAADRASDWVALELRFDRAYQTFARGHFQRLRNLCVLRGDANVVLGSVEAASLGQIYINHPEPPQQRGASLESTGKHLLTREFFVQCERLLERAPGACITVLTDNLWYGRFLINMLNANAATVPLTSFHSAASVAAGSVCEAANDFLLYSEAPLGLQGAAVVEASSYFDRLWKRESVTERYYIVLQRWDLSKRRPQYADLPVAGSAGKGGKDGKGKSCDKSSKGNSVVKVKAVSYASGNEMSQSNSKYSVKCSGVIVAPQGKKQTFDDDDE